ncbi:PREDICTED: uncharacterized protein LOC105452237 [Wasmannia auropunctata]|uniref:uncharacterized protein LOC105452237 n=1 Tax=Wasmannia auropunctata TaxID=64793 RepID=UPI0005F081C4|nr:PREDICTED: uncharacterized protein LOC105452237 [Wasmannia auropunctata]
MKLEDALQEEKKIVEFDDTEEEEEEHVRNIIEKRKHPCKINSMKSMRDYNDRFCDASSILTINPENNPIENKSSTTEEEISPSHKKRKNEVKSSMFTIKVY